ncbi:MAG: TolC family protein [Puniceicoccaceae bacterium]
MKTLKTVGKLRLFGIFGAYLLLSSCQSAPNQPVGPTTPAISKAEIRNTQIPDPPGIPSQKPQPSQIDSFEAALIIALERNPDLRVSRLSIIRAGAFAAIERGEFDPELYARLSTSEQRTTEISRSTSEVFSSEVEVARAAAGLRQRLSTGTEIDLNYSHSREASNRTPEQQEARIGISITQSLLRGFGPSVNLAAVRRADLRRLTSEFELRGLIEALLLNVERSCLEILRLRGSIRILESSLELAQEELQVVETLIEVGELPRQEAAVVRSEVALRQQALINARSELINTRLDLARLLNFGPGFTGEYPFETIDASRLFLSVPDSLPEHLAASRFFRAELNEARLRLSEARLETEVTVNGLLPQLDFFVTLGKSGFSNQFSSALRDLGNDSYDFSAGLEASYPIGNRRREGQHLLAQTDLAEAYLALENLGEQIAFEIHQAFNQVERARQQISATSISRELQEETVRAESEKVAVGTTTRLQLAQAKRELVARQIAELEARIDYRLRILQLYRADGTLIERRGITTGVASTLSIPSLENLPPADEALPHSLHSKGTKDLPPPAQP